MKSIDRHSPTAWFAVMSSSKLHLNGIQTKWDRIQLWWPQSPIVVKPEEDNAHAQIILCDKMSAEKKRISHQGAASGVQGRVANPAGTTIIQYCHGREGPPTNHIQLPQHLAGCG